MNAARQSFTFSAAVSVALAGLFAARAALAPWPLEKNYTGGMPLAARLAEFSAAWPWAGGLVLGVVIVWMLLMIVRLTARGAGASTRNYLPFQIFVVASCGICFSGELLASFLAALLLALSTKRSIDSFRKDYRFEDSFRAGFFLGLIPLLYAPGVILLLLLPLASSLYRRSGRELAVSLGGALLPVPAAGFIHWAFGREASFVYTEIWRCLSVRPGVEFPANFPVVAAVAAGLVVALALAAMVWFTAHRKGMRTRQRKVMYHTVCMFVLTLALAAIPGGGSASAIPLAALPVSMAVPYSFFGKQTLPSSIVYCLILIAVLALNLAPVLGVRLP